MLELISLQPYGFPDDLENPNTFLTAHNKWLPGVRSTQYHSCNTVKFRGWFSLLPKPSQPLVFYRLQYALLQTLKKLEDGKAWEQGYTVHWQLKLGALGLVITHCQFFVYFLLS